MTEGQTLAFFKFSTMKARATTNPQLTQLMQLVLQETDIHIIEHQDKHLNQLVILGDIHVHILHRDNPHPIECQMEIFL